jgi:hypothetical protein
MASFPALADRNSPVRERKESNMTTQLNSSAPAYRLGFAPRTVDSDGQSIIGYPVEIGAVFHRKDREKGLIAKIALCPADLRDGVLLLMPIRQSSEDAPARRSGRGRK